MDLSEFEIELTFWLSKLDFVENWTITRKHTTLKVNHKPSDKFIYEIDFK